MRTTDISITRHTKEFLCGKEYLGNKHMLYHVLGFERLSICSILLHRLLIFPLSVILTHLFVSPHDMYLLSLLKLSPLLWRTLEGRIQQGAGSRKQGKV